MSMYWKNLLKCCGIRAGKTFVQAFVGAIGGCSLLSDVSWGIALSTAALAALISFCTNLVTGLPEVVDETYGGHIVFHNVEEGDADEEEDSDES